MLRFLLGFAATLGIALAICILGSQDLINLWRPPPPAWQLILLVLALPLCVSVLVSDAGARFIRIRMFDTRSHSGLRPLVAGLFAGLLTVLLTITGLIFLDDRLSDTALVSLAALTGSGLIIILLPRARKGHCVRCTYDLKGIGPSPAAATCPECGSVGSAA